MAPACKLILLVFCLIEAGGLQANRWGLLYDEALENFNLGNFKSAEATAGQAYQYWKNEPGSRWRWPFQLLLAESLIEDDQLDDASRLLAGHAPTAAWEARRLVGIAFINFRHKDRPAARRALDSAEAINPKNARDVAGKIELIRGTIYLQENNSAQAEGCFRRGLEFVGGSGTLVESYTLIAFGVADLRSYRNDRSVAWLQRARSMAERYGMKRSVMIADHNLGYSYQQLGDLGQAMRYLDEAVSLARGLDDHVNLLRVLATKGETEFQLGDGAKAESYLNEAIRLASPGKDDEWVSGSLDDLSSIALARGELQTAASLNRRGGEVAERLGTARLLLGSGIQAAEIAAASNDDKGAVKLFTDGLDAASKLGDPFALWSCHAGLASVYRELGRVADSGREYQAAIKIIDEQWAKLQEDDFKLSFLSNLIHFYGGYVDFLFERGDRAAAFRVAQSCRARLLAEKAHPDGAAEPALDLTALQRELRASASTLLSYWLAPTRSFVWVIDGSEINMLQLPAEAEISARVRQYANAIQRGANPIQTADAAGQWLFSTMLPAAVRTSKRGNIIIQPDGALHQLNFESLPVADGSRYWVEDATVSIAPSLTLLRESAKVSSRSLLLFGDPLSTGNNLPQLPNLEAEIAAVSKHYSDKRVFTRAEATPAAYWNAQPGKFSTMHFASHAIANRDSPLDSAIILAGPEYNQKLYARDLIGQPLTAELVTLSACETAGNRTYYGEGMMGFSWAFLSAGARNVVAGLWQVDDRATSRLMERFYDNLAAGQPPAAALRHAKLDLMASLPVYHKPFYWAAFETFTRALYH